MRELLHWMAEGTVTEGGRRSLLQLEQEAETEAGELRRTLGVEALSALQAEEEPSLARCADLLRLAASCRQRVLEGEELMAVAETLERQAELARWSTRHPRFPALAEVIAAMPPLPELREAIRMALDARGQVKDEADPALPRVRGQLRKLHQQRASKLEQVAEGMFQKGQLRQRQPVQRGDRLLLAVRATMASRRAGVVHDRSQSGDTVFLEPTAVLEISNRIVETRFEEQRLIEQVLRELSLQVLRHEFELEQIQQQVSLLDLAFAAGRWAQQVDGCYAQTVPMERGLRLMEARHPLLRRSMEAEQIVPLSLQLGQDFDLLVVTGPNTGGKTLVLKTVGLCVWLAMRGLPLPAGEGSEVPPFRSVLADVGDAQSLQSSLSTFSGHLRRIQRILEQAEAGCLVLLDELGTGTDPEEGSALGQAVLEQLLQCGAWTLANTHLGQLKLFSLDVARAENASMEFDPLTLEPKYRLLVGVPGASHAVEVAERLGLEEGVLDRARALSTRGDGTEQLLADVGRVRREAEILRESASQEEMRILQRSRDLASEESDSRRRRRLREGEAEEEFLACARDVGALLEQEGRSLEGRLPQDQRQALRALHARILERLGEDRLARRWKEFLRGLKKGDRVYVPRLQERLAVLKIDRKRERVKLRQGSFELELPFRELTWVQAPKLQDDEEDPHHR